MLTRLSSAILLAYTWLTLQARRIRSQPRDDRGDALSTAVIAVGLVALAALVILILRQKAQTIANNVCTNADPTTCSTK
ncbi:hypothetical protein [Candidatus Protofrankia californiensis]|uniref:hypothetical protein n=1 Tax=Candidatus Protofrankia californiensis TaxID=1839754 RepID=UPI0010415E8B|nr:hypothetical protein [Candidatus Protofrankia californiensis]